MAETTMRLIPAERLHDQTVAVLTAWGMTEAAIRVTADAMVSTDLSGVDSHGVSMLMDYERSRTLGKLLAW